MANDFSSWFTTLKRHTGSQQWEGSGLRLPPTGAASASGRVGTCPHVAWLGSPGPRAPVAPLNGSQSMITGPAASVSPGNLFARLILRPRLRRRVRHSGDGAQRSVLEEALQEILCTLRFENHWSLRFSGLPRAPFKKQRTERLGAERILKAVFMAAGLNSSCGVYSNRRQP